MESWQVSIQNAWQIMSGWEVIAVVLAIAYLLLAMKESLWCWYAAFISTAIFTGLFWDASLLMESGLQIYYLGMAVFGWYQWRSRSTSETHSSLQIHSWNWQQHLSALALVIGLSLVSGFLLTNHTQAAWPFLDSFTTWGSVVTTYMVTRKVLENWLYWLVIDGISIVLYWDRELYLTAILFIAYLFICIFGFFEWRQQLRRHQQGDSQHSPALS